MPCRLGDLTGSATPLPMPLVSRVIDAYASATPDGSIALPIPTPDLGGLIYGGIAVGAFNRTAGNFTAPTFHTNGGGNSTIQYDSSALKNGIGSGTNVSGIREF